MRVIARREHASLILMREDTRREVARFPVDDLIERRVEKNTGLLVIGPRNADARLHVIGDGIIRDTYAVLPRLRGTGLPVKLLRRIVLIGGVSIGALALLLFIILPSMADRLAAAIPPEHEIEFGKMVRGQIEASFGAETPGNLICQAPQGIDALRDMTRRVLGDAPLPYPLDVVVFDDPLVNAFALPGGHVVLFRGLISAAEHPDEVAAVLAHEIGHVAARDPTRIALQTAGSAGLMGLILGDFAGGSFALAIANQFLQASYSQEAEWAADAYAHIRLGEAGLPPQALATMFERLKERHGDVDGVLGYFSSHPSLGDRAEAARRAAHPATDGEPSLDASQWAALRAICD